MTKRKLVAQIAGSLPDGDAPLTHPALPRVNVNIILDGALYYAVPVVQVRKTDGDDEIPYIVTVEDARLGTGGHSTVDAALEVARRWADGRLADILASLTPPGGLQ